MRKMLPILLSVLAVGCSMPKTHDSRLITKPKIPYVEEAPPPQPLSEGSLWQDRPVVGDLRANRLNDLVTIKISESTSAISKADVTTARDGSNKLGTGGLFGSLANLGSVADSRSTATTNKYKGNGTTGRSATFNTTVTARVVKVLNNGNLIFEGFRDIQLNNESQRLYVAGLVDPRRLDAANSTTSDQVAELRVGYGGKGVVDETLKPGFISRLLNLIWPY
jgi:flagellar L-ring protein precursor FlgH